MKRIAVGLVALALLAGSPAWATASRSKLRLNPTVALVNGQTIRVKGSGWTPNGKYMMQECTSAFPSEGLDACLSNGPVKVGLSTMTFPADSAGRINWRRRAWTGTVGANGGVCDRDHSCLYVFAPFRPNGKTVNLNKALVFPISFS